MLLPADVLDDDDDDDEALLLLTDAGLPPVGILDDDLLLGSDMMALRMVRGAAEKNGTRGDRGSTSFHHACGESEMMRPLLESSE